MSGDSSARGRRAAVVAGAVLATLVLALVATRRENEGDLRTYYNVATRVWEGRDPYRTFESAEGSRRVDFTYPPTFALLVVPMVWLPWAAVRLGWAWLNGLLALRAVVLAAGFVFPGGLRIWLGRDARRWLALAAFGALLGRFVWSDLGHGQINILLAWLVLEALALLRREREPGAGVVLALATVMKLVPGLALVGLVVGGRRRMGAWAAGAGLLLAVVPPVVAWGPAEAWSKTWRWATEVTPWSARAHGAVDENLAPSALVQRLLAGAAQLDQPRRTLLLALDPEAARLAGGALSAAIALGALVAARRAAELPGRAALLCAALPLASPVAWKTHLAWLVLPALLAARHLGDGARGRTLLLAALALLLPGRALLGRELADGAVRWGAVTLGLALLWAGLWRAEPAPPWAAGAAPERADVADAGTGTDTHGMARAPDA